MGYKFKDYYNLWKTWLCKEEKFHSIYRSETQQQAQLLETSHFVITRAAIITHTDPKQCFNEEIDVISTSENTLDNG